MSQWTALENLLGLSTPGCYNEAAAKWGFTVHNQVNTVFCLPFIDKMKAYF